MWRFFFFFNNNNVTSISLEQPYSIAIEVTYARYMCNFLFLGATFKKGKQVKLILCVLLNPKCFQHDINIKTIHFTSQ